MKKSVVCLVKNSDPEKAVRESLRLLGGPKAFIHQGYDVLIKPNLGFPFPPDMAPYVTSPEVIAALVKLFIEAGAGRVIVGDQSAWGIRARDTCRITGVEDAVRKAGGEMCYFDEEPRIMVDVPNGRVFDKLSLPKIVKEVDFIVNTPKMKTSLMGKVTLGMKNCCGFLTFEDMQKFHREYDLAYVIAGIFKAVRPGLTIIDGIIAMEGGAGAFMGSPVRMDLIVASRDVVAADAVATTIMGFDPLEPPTTQVGMKFGLGTADLSKIQIVGDPVESLKRYFRRPITTVVNPYPNVLEFVGGMCPGCAPRISKIPPNPDPNKKYAVVIGRRPAITKEIDVDEVWALGKCGIDSTMASMKFFKGISKKNIKMVPGCPPLKWFAEQTIFKMLKEKGWATEFTAR